MKKILDIITNIIIIFLLIIGLYYFIGVYVNKIPKEDIFNYTLYRVSTGSMGDAIKINDIIIVKKTKNVKQNDIIAFEQDGNLIVHRIIKINDNTLVTKGDLNNQEDDPIEYEQIIGKVIKKIPLNYIILAIIVVIALNIIMICIDERLKIKNEK